MTKVDESRNPYWDESEVPQLKPSVVAFVDILGYQDIVQEAEGNGTGQQLLEKLHEVLTVSHDFVFPADGIMDRIFYDKDRSKARTFTDNIVIGHPIIHVPGWKDASWELNSMIYALSCFQTEMVNAGFFVRGAISIGNLYMDETVVYGQGLIDAHLCESQLARDPRIILTESTYEVVHEKDDGRGRSITQIDSIFKDVDGQLFLNYLDYRILIAEHEIGPDYAEVQKHKDAIETKLARYQNQPLIWNKYAWSANYHNYFCDQYTHYFSNDYKIDMSKHQMQPTLITDGKNET